MALSEELKSSLHTIDGAQAFAKALDFDLKKIRPIVRSDRISKYYTEFLIKKKDGTDRVISAPSPYLKSVQRKIAGLLNEVYEPKPSAHGFVLGKSIESNASMHLKKRFVLNIDLKDFFSSINFGRVWGALQSKPYCFSRDVATLIAQISTCDNKLPQGAPTSPILSNIVCRKLDRELQILAKDNKCSYSRYADDITFSTSLRKFPANIAVPKLSEDKVDVLLGATLLEKITQNGFTVNEKKVRMQLARGKQSVTGLKVNQKINIEKKYTSQIRATLHAWKKFGYDAALKKYIELGNCKKRTESIGEGYLSRVIFGKLSYVKRYKGDKNITFRKLSNEYFKLTGNWYRYSLDPLDEIKSNLWIIESIGEDELVQGTAFSIGESTLATCAHVIGKNPHVFRYDRTEKKYPVSVESVNDDIDLAIVKISVPVKDLSPDFLKIEYNARLAIGDEIVVSGFPEYAPGHEPFISKCRISSFRMRSLVRRIITDKPIYHGNSGGPVLNQKNKVIGVAVTGALTLQDTKETAEYGIIPIDALKELKK